MIVLSVWSFLLQRCSGGEKRVLFGSVLPQKNQHSHRVGCLTPIVPTLVDLDELSNPDISGSGILLWPFISKISRRVETAQEFACCDNISLLDIQKQSEVSTDYQLFDSLFVVDEIPDRPKGTDNSSSQPFGQFLMEKEDNIMTNWHYPLVLYLRDKVHNSCETASCEMKIIYDKHYFEDATGNQIRTYLSTLLEGVSVADTEQRVHLLPILPEEEQKTLIVKNNDNSCPYPKDKRIEQLIEEQASKTPDRIAIIFEDKEMTFAQIEKKANQLAHYLHAEDIGPGTILAIYM